MRHIRIKWSKIWPATRRMVLSGKTNDDDGSQIECQGFRSLDVFADPKHGMLQERITG